MMTDELTIDVDLETQTLNLYAGSTLLKSYPVSTAKNGAGEIMDSECTPRGEHIIAEKIGAGSEVNSVFVGRKETGEIYQAELRQQFPERDWILTRILWLKGLEQGRNLGTGVDSYKRYIYIHGSPEDVDMSVPGSHGCIRMSNDDVIDLFDRVDEGTRVLIREV